MDKTLSEKKTQTCYTQSVSTNATVTQETKITNSFIMYTHVLIFGNNTNHEKVIYYCQLKVEIGLDNQGEPALAP